jgi:hypothetical protein
MQPNKQGSTENVTGLILRDFTVQSLFLETSSLSREILFFGILESRFFYLNLFRAGIQVFRAEWADRVFLES